MKNADMPAMAQQVIIDAYGGIVTASEHDKDYMGLTKREHFAGLAMQGLLAHYGVAHSGDSDTYCSTAIKYADALLKKLEK